MKDFCALGMGMRIRERRELLGYTREALAEKLDVTPKFCNDIELGVRGMSLSTLCKMSDVLKMSTDFILFGESRREPQGDPVMTGLIESVPLEKRKDMLEILKILVRMI